MIKGEFVENIPLIKIIVSWGQAVQTPQVTPKLARELGLQAIGVTKSRIANGQIVNMPTALALATMEGTNKYIQVLISDSMPLLGISFLSKFNYKAIINCRYKTISLSQVNA